MFYIYNIYMSINKTYLSGLISGNAAKRVILGSCKNTTGNKYCNLYSLGITLVYIVSSLSDSGKGSLREGINLINNNDFNNPNFFYIVFEISGTIILNSNLPEINKSIILFASKNITIDLNNYSGLNINSDNTIINGISIINSNNSGINIYSNYNFITNCYICNNNQNGIYLAPGTKYNKIGDNPMLDSNYISNIIANNGNNGIKIDNSSDNIIKKNYIGTIDGSTAASNGNNGIYLTNNSTNNIIGGKAFKNSRGLTNNPTGSEGKTTPVYIIPPEGNLISGNIENGILIDNNSNNNTLFGNFIGTTNLGLTSLSNGLNGVKFSSAPNNSLIGCEVYTNPFIFYNVISGNNYNGVEIYNSNNCVIQGNFIGITMNNQQLCPNQLDGLLVNGTSTGVTDGGVIPLGNVISGNNKNGIHLTDNVTQFISFNTFAGIFAFGGAAPNKLNGMLLDENVNYNTVRTNVVSGNIENGILLTGSSSYTTIENLICGTDSNSSYAVPNKNGLTIAENSNNNIITTTASVAYANVISGNLENGIQLLGNSNNHKFFNCRIGGSDILNGNTIPNGQNGVYIDGAANNNVFTQRTDSNKLLINEIISNNNYGIYFNTLTAIDNTFTYNYIGINRDNKSYPNGRGNFGGNIDSSNIITPNYT